VVLEKVLEVDPVDRVTLAEEMGVEAREEVRVTITVSLEALETQIEEAMVSRREEAKVTITVSLEALETQIEEAMVSRREEAKVTITVSETAETVIVEAKEMKIHQEEVKGDAVVIMTATETVLQTDRMSKIKAEVAIRDPTINLKAVEQSQEVKDRREATEIVRIVLQTLVIADILHQHSLHQDICQFLFQNFQRSVPIQKFYKKQ